MVLCESGLIGSDESEVLKRVNSIRGDFVHNIFRIVEIDDKDQAFDLVKDCQDLLRVIGNLLHEQVTYDSEIYDIIIQNTDESS